MSDGRMTEREKVRLQREAYATALIEHGDWTQASAETLVSKRYPLPKITRPRVVQIGELEYRVVEKEYAQLLEFRNIVAGVPETAWWPCEIQISAFTSHDLRLIADLYDRPTEEVEDE